MPRPVRSRVVSVSLKAPDLPEQGKGRRVGNPLRPPGVPPQRPVRTRDHGVDNCTPLGPGRRDPGPSDGTRGCVRTSFPGQTVRVDSCSATLRRGHPVSTTWTVPPPHTGPLHPAIAVRMSFTRPSDGRGGLFVLPEGTVSTGRSHHPLSRDVPNPRDPH